MKEYLKLTEEEREALHNNFLQEPDAFYEKAEMDQLRAALQRTTKERFLVMTSLMKMSIMFSKAKITIKKDNSGKV
jgi:hypothetical protein